MKKKKTATLKLTKREKAIAELTARIVIKAMKKLEVESNRMVFVRDLTPMPPLKRPTGCVENWPIKKKAV